MDSHSTTRHRHTILAIALIATTATACSDDGFVEAAFVLLGADSTPGSTFAEARVIVSGNNGICPTLKTGSESVHMLRRNNPFGFVVDVCQARIAFDESYQISWNGQHLPTARRDPQRLAVLGDSGCKEKTCADGTLAEPFQTIASQVAALDPRPDVLLHVGDYNYRGTSSSLKFDNGTEVEVYDAGDNVPDDLECQLDGTYWSQNGAYIPARNDNWEDWRDDFFLPAGDLLTTAPWIFARGNHELCSRAGPGYFYFLDPTSDASNGGTGQQSCPPQGGNTPFEDGALPHIILKDPYTVDLGTLRVAVIDSANACDNFAPERMTQPYTDQLVQALAPASDGTPTWMLSHRPFVGAVTQDSGGNWTTLNPVLQIALRDALDQSFDGSLPASLQMWVAGHMHTIQILTPIDAEAERRPQIVMGGSGVALAGDSPDGSFELVIDEVDTDLLAIYQHGYLDVENYQADGSWNGSIIGTDGSTLAACGSGNLPAPICNGEGP
jgi:hypothetical protein